MREVSSFLFATRVRESSTDLEQFKNLLTGFSDPYIIMLHPSTLSLGTATKISSHFQESHVPQGFLTKS